MLRRTPMARLARLRDRKSSYVRFSSSIAQLHAANIQSANDAEHIRRVHGHLMDSGVLKIVVGFEDKNSSYLEQLIQNLNKNHSHGLPITHSASRGWFWDVRPSAAADPTVNRARSETAQDFPWHTDCSYEKCPPRFFALQVLQHDRCGGGTLSILNSVSLLGLLSPTTRQVLAEPGFQINVPQEFIKTDETFIIGSVLGVDEKNQLTQLRLREDIITPLTEESKAALEELRAVLRGPGVKGATLHLSPEMIPSGSIVLIDNRRWLHARNEVKDPGRHLRRVRWDARPFATASGAAA
ncbi:hypothetical protein MferCBS31731_000507 [Microsporum ferrugineum]